MSEDLKQDLVRLGAERQDLRKHIRPLLAELDKEARPMDPSMRKAIDGHRTVEMHAKNLERTAEKLEKLVGNLRQEARSIWATHGSPDEILTGDHMRRAKDLIAWSKDLKHPVKNLERGQKEVASEVKKVAEALMELGIITSTLQK